MSKRVIRLGMEKESQEEYATFKVDIFESELEVINRGRAEVEVKDVNNGWVIAGYGGEMNVTILSSGEQSGKGHVVIIKQEIDDARIETLLDKSINFRNEKQREGLNKTIEGILNSLFPSPVI